MSWCCPHFRLRRASLPGGMAAKRSRAAMEEQEKEKASTRSDDREQAVNRWVLQFYFHQAVAAYRAGRNRDFRQLRDVMQGAGRRAGRGWGHRALRNPPP